MKRSIGALLVCLTTLGATVAVAQETADPAVWALFELNQRFYYAGDPFQIRVSVGYDGGDKIANPVKVPLAKGFQIRKDGELLDPSGEIKADPDRPGKLGQGSFYGRVIELSEVYPQLLEVGEFEISWSVGDVQAQTVTVQMIPKYDPNREYRAVLDTSMGPIELRFYKDVSPLAVKNFIDLAHAGFYEGLTFHEVQRDRYIVAGDPLGTGAGGAGYAYPAEASTLPVVAGTVLMKPVSPSPPANSSQFLIMLRPEPAWTGQFTVLGQVVQGLDVARKMSQVESSGVTNRPYHKPLRDIEIRGLTVTLEGATGTAEQPDGEAR